MANLLNLAMAAKMAGVSRKDVQEQIRAGKLHTFEGMIRVNELIRVYPAAKLQDTEMLDTVTRIKDQAVHKVNDHCEERLLQQVVQLQKELANEHRRSAAFAQVVIGLRDRLLEMQQQCEKKDKILLEAMVGWLATQMDKNAIG